MAEQNEPQEVDGVPVHEAIRVAVKGLIDKARTPDFMDRLHKLVADEGLTLERIEGGCKHAYPQPNGQGFPVNQCLNCGEWKDQ